MHDSRMMGSLCVTIATILVTILVNISTAMGDSYAKCGQYQHNLNGQRCCTECSPGQGVLRTCASDNDTFCQSCIFGESYSTMYSHIETCHPCSICPEYAHMIQPCNRTHDTMCQCDRNYFFDELSQKCRPCRFCPMEYGVWRQCNLTHDAECGRCTEGMFSDRLSREPCKRCGVCRMNQVMLQHCSPGQDTICIDIPTIHNTPWSRDVVTEHSASEKKDIEHRTNPIPIYCSFLGAVIVALIVYVVIKQNRRRQLLKNKNHNLSVSNSAESPPLLSTLPSSGGIVSKQGSDSGVYMEQDRPVTNSTKIRDMPAIKRKALENSMHGYRDDQGGWKALARELGFSSPVICSIETRAHQDGFSPLRILLCEWGKRDNAIVGTLVQALRNIRRDDCVRILCGDNRDYVVAPKYNVIDLGSLQHSQIV